MLKKNARYMVVELSANEYRMAKLAVDTRMKREAFYQKKRALPSLSSLPSLPSPPSLSETSVWTKIKID